MAHHSLPLASEFKSLTEGIQYVLSQNIPSLVVVGSDREDFLRDMSSECFPPPPEASGADGNNPQARSLSPILIPTIRLIARSRNVRVAFVPTLMHFRAYLSTLPTHSGLQSPYRNLFVLNFLHLHRSTSEFSAQGISRSLALVIDSVLQSNLSLRLIEVHPPFQPGEGGEDSNGPVFKERVPILSRGPRSDGSGRVWGGRTVEVGAIIARWCKIDPALEQGSAV